MSPECIQDIVHNSTSLKPATECLRGVSKKYDKQRQGVVSVFGPYDKVGW